MQRPESSVQSPASRVQHPESSVQSPASNSCVQSPGILVCDIIADSVIRENENRNGLYIPSNISCEKRTYFAIHNLGFYNDTPKEIKENHGPTHVVLQKFSKSEVCSI